MHRTKTLWSLGIIFLNSLLFIGCNSDKKGNSGGNAPSVRTYKVIEIKEHNITLENIYPASIEGEQNIEIRPKVDGFISKIHVDEGAFVKKGQLLFEIEAPQYEQDLRSARANIEIAQANVNTAEMELNKIRPLVERNIISSFELENAEFNLASKQAILVQANAQLTNAKANYQYTKIHSPVDGVLGTIPYKIGSLVSGNTPMPLTTVSNIGKVYAYFSLNEKQILEFGIHQGQLAEYLRNKEGIQLKLANGTIYPETGTIETVSGQINVSTGSISARATFPNSDYTIRSGSSGSVLIPQHIENNIIIPQSTTFEVQGQKFVYVVDAENNVQQKAVKVLSNNDGQNYVVKDGLVVGEKVVFEGVHTLRNGETINPELVPFEIKEAE